MVFDGVSFFRDFSIPYYTQSKNASQGWYSLRCPFHGDHTDHMGFNPSSGAMSCWICGKKSALDFVKTVLGISRSEASVVFTKYLVNGTGRGVLCEKKKATGTSIALPGKDFTNAERKYLERRNMDLDVLGDYDLRSGGYVDPWAYRIVIPVIYNKTIVSATGRAISKQMQPKYWTLPMDREIIHHKHIFLGLDMVDDIAVVVEGPIDAIRGGPGFIASFGVNLTDEQLCLLLRYKYVVFLQDSDEAGAKFAEQAYKLSALGADNVELAHLPDGFKDVGEMGDNDISCLRKELGLCVPV